MLSHSDYVTLIEDEYFGSMAAGRPERSVRLFAAGGVLTACFPGLPVRVARHDPGAAEETLDHFFGAVLETFQVSYSGFWHSVDVPAERICSTYTLHLSPRSDPADVRELRNANFFQFSAGRLREVLVVSVGSGRWTGLRPGGPPEPR